MPRADFDRVLSVSSSPERVWDVITDVPRLVEWISVVDDAQEVEPLAKYTAELMDRLGPFKLRARLDISLSGVEPGHALTLRAEGEDRHVGSRLAVDARLQIDGGGDSATRVRIAGVYEVTGRAASMGPGTINKKAAKILDEFFAELSTELGAA